MRQTPRRPAAQRRLASGGGLQIGPALPLIGGKPRMEVIEHCKALAEETGIPYQNLINLYLRECAQTRKKPAFSWAS